MSLANERRRTWLLLLSGVILAVGTPLFLTWHRRDLRGYLLHPVLVAIEALPYLLGAALWVPWRDEGALRVGRRLAGLLLLASAAIHVPLLAGMMPLGGDMVGLGFAAVGLGSSVGVLLCSAICYGFRWVRKRRQG